MDKQTFLKVCEMRYDGYTMKEIATELKYTVSCISVTITRTLKETKYTKTPYVNINKAIRTGKIRIGDIVKVTGLNKNQVLQRLSMVAKFKSSDVEAISKLLKISKEEVLQTNEV